MRFGDSSAHIRIHAARPGRQDAEDTEEMEDEELIEEEEEEGLLEDEELEDDADESPTR
jgi:hypothetical protein